MKATIAPRDTHLSTTPILRATFSPEVCAPTIAAEVERSAYAEEIDAFFDSRQNRELRALMQTRSSLCG